MPYYLYKICSSDGLGLVKNLDLKDVFQKFKDAKKKAREFRTESEPNSVIKYQVIFAESQLSAEEQLLEKRAKPVLMEYER
jgi:hypothetical protein